MHCDWAVGEGVAKPLECRLALNLNLPRVRPEDSEQSFAGRLPFCNAHVKLRKVPRASDLGSDRLEGCKGEGREEQVD